MVVLVVEATEVVVDMVAAVVEDKVVVEEVSLHMVEEAMVVGALFPPMVVEEGEEEIPSQHMVEEEAHKPLTEEVAA